MVTQERSRGAPPASRTAGQYAGFGIRVFGHLLDTPSIIHLNEREQKTLSVLLNVRRDTVRDWRSGRNPIRPQVWSDPLSLIVHQRDENQLAIALTALASARRSTAA